MYNFDSIVKRFADAGLVLKRAKSSMADNDGVFGITIKRGLKGNTRNEYFEMWPGADENIIQVQGVDKDIGQLVLTVKEERREFWENVPSWAVAQHGMDTWRRNNQVRDVRVVNGTLQAKHRTTERRRHYLLGVDERQLFLSQLNKACTTVREAHESLKHPTVTTVEGKQRAIRQGEWFFLSISLEEEKTLNERIRKNELFIQKKPNIGAVAAGRPRIGGNPHTADEVVTTPAARLAHGFTVQGHPNIYVRGKVRHKDHATVSFSHWHRVLRNTENTESGRTFGGWVD